jgi:hypothetical protein
MAKLTLFIVFLALTGLAARADLAHGDTKESLRGLTGVYVVAQIIDVQVPGLSTNEIEKLVKSELINTGVTVDTAPKESNGNATLTVTLATVMQPQLNLYLFTVEVSVTQDVQLSRQPHLHGISAQTWRRTTQGLTTPDHTDIILQSLKQALDSFSKNYHSVNH